jgi:uncharacterized membrane protein
MIRQLTAEEVRSSERLIANTLKLGAYASFALLLIGLGMIFAKQPRALAVARFGIIALLAAPVLRILAAILMYAKERDTKMILVSLWILSVIGLSALAGVVTH